MLAGYERNEIPDRFRTQQADPGAYHSTSFRGAAVWVLVAQRRWRVSATADDIETATAENAIAERIRHFADLGLLDAEDPRRTMGHFFALTVLLAFSEQPNLLAVNQERLRPTMIDGIRALVRAYGAR